MKLCIPTMEAAGWESHLSSHFGSAPYFAIVDIEVGTLEFRANDNAHHEHGSCSPVKAIVDSGAQAAMVRGMGARAIMALQSQGVPVFQTSAETVRDAADECASGTCMIMDPSGGCHGHHH